MTRPIPFLRTLLLCLAAAVLFSCEREEVGGKLELEKNNRTILNYLEGNPSYSILTRALQTTQLSGILNVYGAMTLFAPTDEAFKKYLSQKGVSDISQVPADTLRRLLEYHLYNNRYDSRTFVSGSLPETNVEGSFLRFDISRGLRSTLINDQAQVDSLDIQAANGVVHVVNEVLLPPANTMYSWLKTQPQYSIMLEAFEKTGNDSILKNVVYVKHQVRYGRPVRKWRTVFLETNQVLQQAGISSFDELARKYSDSYHSTRSYGSLSDSLNIFVRYHALDRKYFVSDFKTQYLETFGGGNFLILSTTPGLSINRHEEISVVTDPVSGQSQTVKTYPQVSLVLDQSNQVMRNGIIHQVNKVLELYIPKPAFMRFLFAGAPEDRPLVLPDGRVSNIVDAFKELTDKPEHQSVVPWLKWKFDGNGYITSAWPSNVFGNDYSLVLSKNTQPYTVELTTPPIFKGTYKVYVVYRFKNSSVMRLQYYWDDKPMGDQVDMKATNDRFGNESWRNDRRIAYGIGVVTLKENGSHKFRIEYLTPSLEYVAWYALELEPVL